MPRNLEFICIEIFAQRSIRFGEFFQGCVVHHRRRTGEADRGFGLKAIPQDRKLRGTCTPALLLRCRRRIPPWSTCPISASNPSVVQMVCSV